MTPPTTNDHATDADLWTLVRAGNNAAFEVLVKRYQSLVCAVAYSRCGDLALSEDVAQETFWTAWRASKSLLHPDRLGPWLCGIARNLGKNARRRRTSPVESAASIDSLADQSTAEPGPEEQVVSREQESLVWDSLSRIPETYRLPLILFYRENQSVAEVARALDLSESAVKQRLSRGRSLLRDEVAGIVEGGLRRSRPGRAFTVAVMTGVAAGSAGANAAAAGITGGAAPPLIKAAAAAAGGVAGGSLAALFGTLFGLGGGWLGTWIPAQVAHLEVERLAIMRTGRRVMAVCVLSLPALWLLARLLGGSVTFFIALGLWIAAVQVYIAIEVIRLNRRLRQARRDAGPGAQTNTRAIRTGIDRVSKLYRGRVFRSRASLFGLPVIDINVADPAPRLPQTDDPSPDRPRIARGWIAIGDDARGIILAVGGSARGAIALGGRAIGLISVGGVAVGVVACGGLALGVISVAGLAVGVTAIGGGAIGWQAAGGGAIAWDTAVAGFAIARHAAFGGAAFARDLAVGGAGHAAHFNDDAAKAVLLHHPLKLGMDWCIANKAWLQPAVLVGAFVPSILSLPVFYRRETPTPSGPGIRDPQP